MMQALLTASTGLSAQQKRIDIISNNMANVNTTAFKSSDAQFKDALYTTMENPDLNAQPTNLQRGTGVALSSTPIDFSQGSTRVTGKDLDLLINGNAFFRLVNYEGEFVYTKDGSFTVSAEGGRSYLVNSAGYYLLDEYNNRISVAAGSGAISIQGNGTIEADGRMVRIGVYSFENEGALLSVGGNLFTESASSGEAAASTDYNIVQGALESSNVDLAKELTRLIQAQRVFSLASRALQTTDNMEGLANNIRR